MLKAESICGKVILILYSPSNFIFLILLNFNITFLLIIFFLMVFDNGIGV